MAEIHSQHQAFRIQRPWHPRIINLYAVSETAFPQRDKPDLHNKLSHQVIIARRHTYVTQKQIRKACGVWFNISLSMHVRIVDDIMHSVSALQCCSHTKQKPSLTACSWLHGGDVWFSLWISKRWRQRKHSPHVSAAADWIPSSTSALNHLSNFSRMRPVYQCVYMFFFKRKKHLTCADCAAWQTHNTKFMQNKKHDTQEQRICFFLICVQHSPQVSTDTPLDCVLKALFSDYTFLNASVSPKR